MSSIALSLDAEAPVDGVWGVGHTGGCKFESSKVGYTVDGMVSYYGIDNGLFATLIKASMQKVGITVSSNTEGGVIRGKKNSFAIDATPTGTVTDPAGMSISFSTDCLNVGQNLARELAGESPSRGAGRSLSPGALTSATRFSDWRQNETLIHHCRPRSCV